MNLPGDNHVHSEYSWDTGGPKSRAAGTMLRTCAHAVRTGVPAVAFTEHLDIRGWMAAPEDFLEHQRYLIGEDGWMQPPPMDVEGYFQSVESYRRRFPDLRILTGVEFGQPHLDGTLAAAVIDFDRLDRILGSLHTLSFRGSRCEPSTMFREVDDPADVIWAYLAEVPVMVAGGEFEVFTHIDYATRSWPLEQYGPFDPRHFEEGFRQAMRAIAESGRALEINTGHGLQPWIPRWWTQEGGRAVTFGSDDHLTTKLAADFREAADLLDHLGYQPGRRPEDPWRRRL